MVRRRNIAWSQLEARQNVGPYTICVTGLISPEPFAGRCADEKNNVVQVQGTNIRHYYTYVLARAKAFRDTRIDWVREGVGRLKRQSIDKGLLRETEAVQNQINSLLKCDVSRRSLTDPFAFGPGMLIFVSSFSVQRPKTRSRSVLSACLRWTCWFSMA